MSPTASGIRFMFGFRWVEQSVWDALSALPSQGR
ncbi:hypothetical protein DmGdi_24670 [Gluconobacter sp. Gdi]|nr:hypothetical protein DmGdi_24670 [Gluconobacter sp. Gdi]